jgi:hypothetical protein
MTGVKYGIIASQRGLFKRIQKSTRLIKFLFTEGEEKKKSAREYLNDTFVIK